MKALMVGLMALTSLGACADETTLLDASHWRNYQGEGISGGWQAEGDTLSVVSSPAGDLISKETYSSFDLTFEWKISEAGNSGIFFHVQESPDLPYVFYSGPEFQLLDNKGRDEPPLEQAGSLFALYAPSDDYTKPVGEFNTSRLVVEGSHVQHWLNGHKVVEYDMDSEAFKSKVAASKFGKWPAFAAKRSGHLALQDHGNPVTFRNIRIKHLTD
ncbi:3-keto-disaccharide hydrolase [Kordiimonas aestuarii]|uniref:3-keto-disaccharide hydrolase n=1 Tax=Kordiimonas aestuarii TaxID=1005925 RepID=UPI0021D0C41A|nr:DUF1080 domain-containing protein [Kordiimonas aestuarii]